MASKNITHSDLTDIVFNHPDNKYKRRDEATKAINAVVRAVHEAVANNDKVVLKHIGVIEKKYNASREVINKETLQPEFQNEHYTISITVNSKLIETANESLAIKGQGQFRKKATAAVRKAKEKDKVKAKKSGRPKLKKKATKKAEAEKQVELEI